MMVSRDKQITAQAGAGENEAEQALKAKQQRMESRRKGVTALVRARAAGGDQKAKRLCKLNETNERRKGERAFVQAKAAQGDQEALDLLARTSAPTPDIPTAAKEHRAVSKSDRRTRASRPPTMNEADDRAGTVDTSNGARSDQTAEAIVQEAPTRAIKSELPQKAVIELSDDEMELFSETKQENKIKRQHIDLTQDPSTRLPSLKQKAMENGQVSSRGKTLPLLQAAPARCGADEDEDEDELQLKLKKLKNEAEQMELELKLHRLRKGRP